MFSHLVSIEILLYPWIAGRLIWINVFYYLQSQYRLINHHYYNVVLSHSDEWMATRVILLFILAASLLTVVSTILSIIICFQCSFMISNWTWLIRLYLSTLTLSVYDPFLVPICVINQFDFMSMKLMPPIECICEVVVTSFYCTQHFVVTLNQRVIPRNDMKKLNHECHFFLLILSLITFSTDKLSRYSNIWISDWWKLLWMK